MRRAGIFSGIIVRVMVNQLITEEEGGGGVSRMHLIVDLFGSHALCGALVSGIGGSVVECSPATRAARVRFPADAFSLARRSIVSVYIAFAL